jgi:hypothetical protein
MKIILASYQKVFSVGAYVTERIGLEASIDDSENPEAALAILKGLVTKFHTENNPQLAVEIVADNPAVPVVNIEKQDEEPTMTEQEMLERMDSAESVEALERDFKYLKNKYASTRISFAKNAARLLSFTK